MDSAYIVPEGNFQNFSVTANILTVNGDQLGDKDDTIIIDLSPQGGVTISLHNAVATFEPGAFTSITVNTGTGQNHVYVQDTNVPVTINGGSNDTVDIGNAGSVQG